MATGVQLIETSALNVNHLFLNHHHPLQSAGPAARVIAPDLQDK